MRGAKIWGCLGLAVALMGCPVEKRDKPVDPAGSSLADQLDPVKPAPAPQPAGENPAPAPAPPSFPMDNTQLQDKKALLAEKPHLVEVEARIKITDPITGISQAYFGMAQRVQLMGLQHTLNAYKAEHDKNPTFKEFQQMYTQSGASLAGLQRWRYYAYDEATGELCILEDKEFKKSEYAKAGLELKE